LSFTSTDKEIREKAVEFVKKCVEVSRELESGVIIGSIKGKYQISYEDRWYYLKGCLAECVKEAANCGVYILLEPLNRYESNIINTLDEGIRLIKELSSDQIKLMGDTFHMNIEEQSIYDAIKNAKRYLAHFHLADNNRLAPGQGHLDFKKIIKALKEIGYKGFVSAEILPKPDQYTAAKLAIEHIKSLI
jgi:sugar phosphate isomerase/epimerase